MLSPNSCKHGGQTPTRTSVDTLERDGHHLAITQDALSLATMPFSASLTTQTLVSIRHSCQRRRSRYPYHYFADLAKSIPERGFGAQHRWRLLPRGMSKGYRSRGMLGKLSPGAWTDSKAPFPEVFRRGQSGLFCAPQEPAYCLHKRTHDGCGVQRLIHSCFLGFHLLGTPGRSQPTREAKDGHPKHDPWFRRVSSFGGRNLFRFISLIFLSLDRPAASNWCDVVSSSPRRLYLWTDHSRVRTLCGQATLGRS